MPKDLDSAEIRDIITHISTHVTPSLSQADIDYFFQYQWKESFDRGMVSIIGQLAGLESVPAKERHQKLPVMFPGKRDQHRQGEVPVPGLRYWHLYTGLNQ